jgi:hypothetical protein
MQLKVQYIFWFYHSQDVGQWDLVGVLFKDVSQQWWITSSLRLFGAYLRSYTVVLGLSWWASWWATNFILEWKLLSSTYLIFWTLLIQLALVCYIHHNMRNSNFWRCPSLLTSCILCTSSSFFQMPTPYLANNAVSNFIGKILDWFVLFCMYLEPWNNLCPWLGSDSWV